MESIEPHSPIAFEDEDEYENKDDNKPEDAGELDLSGANNSLFLTRMPDFLWESLSTLKNDDEIRVGTLRVEGDKHNPAKVSLMLDNAVKAFEYVPREYNLRVMNRSSSNTFVFTEKDLPGYRRRGGGPTTQPGRTQPEIKREGNARRGFRMPGYRRAIPKKTALTGHVKSEFICLPVENEEYVTILRNREAAMPKGNLAPAFIEGTAGMSNILMPGSVGAGGSFGTFIRTAPTREKKQQHKAARIPKNELLDLLFACFRRYKYWYLRDLRMETQQPESYLRETLEGIAELQKQGAQANTWRLKPGMVLGNADASSFEKAEEQVAPTKEEPDGPSDDDDDEEMEDV